MKSQWQSKLFWTGVLVAAGGALSALLNWEPLPPEFRSYVDIALGVTIMVLRKYFTTEAISK